MAKRKPARPALTLTRLLGSFILITLVIVAVFIAWGWFMAQTRTDKEGFVTIAPVKSEPATPLSDEEYARVLKQIEQLVEDEDPSFALDKLAVMMETDPSVTRSCHAFVHEIGHVSYHKYQNFQQAMSFQEDLCGSGYIHGVIESHLKGVPNPLSEVQTLCDPFTATGDQGKCYHGIGHGFMFYTDNDLPASIKMCDNLQVSEKRGYCAEGVYMENFSSLLELHHTEYVKADDPFYPCAEQPEFYKPTCYYYAPIYYLSLNQDNFESALVWCETAEVGYQEFCARGVGSRFAKQNIKKPPLSEQLCLSSSSLHAACIEGVLSYHMVHFDSYAAGVELCQNLSPASQVSCKSALDKRETWFSD